MQSYPPQLDEILLYTTLLDEYKKKLSEEENVVFQKLITKRNQFTEKYYQVPPAMIRRRYYYAITTSAIIMYGIFSLGFIPKTVIDWVLLAGLVIGAGGAFFMILTIIQSAMIHTIRQEAESAAILKHFGDSISFEERIFLRDINEMEEKATKN